MATLGMYDKPRKARCRTPEQGDMVWRLLPEGENSEKGFIAQVSGNMCSATGQRWPALLNSGRDQSHLNDRMDYLRLQFEPDDESVGELFATVAVGGFAGTASAWFSTSDLRDFAVAVSAYPLSNECPPSLSSGLGGNAFRQPQTTVLLRLDQHDALGTVRVTVQLATEVWNDEERDLARSVTARFLVTYGDLSRFSLALSELLDGHTGDAVLTSTPT